MIFAQGFQPDVSAFQDSWRNIHFRELTCFRGHGHGILRHHAKTASANFDIWLRLSTGERRVEETRSATRSKRPAWTGLGPAGNRPFGRCAKTSKPAKRRAIHTWLPGGGFGAPRRRKGLPGKDDR